MKTLKLAIIVILIIMIGLITLYLVQFNGGLSDSQTDWGTFGDYLSGIFAVFNLGVVVLLTVYVSMNEDKRIEQARIEQQLRNEQELKFQKERSERELQVHKKITIFNVRVQEFEDLNQLLNTYNRDNLEISGDKYRKIASLRQMVEGIDSYISDDNILFPAKGKDFQMKGVSLGKYIVERIGELDGNFNVNYGFPNYQNLRLAFRRSVYTFILDELNND